MMSTANFKGALGKYIDETGELPASVLIGHVVMFTIMDTPIERSELEKHFVDLGLDTSLLPPEITPLDAFRKATSAAKETHTLPNGNTVSVLCRDVASTNHQVTRQITAEFKDSNRRSLNYTRGIECTYMRGKPRPGETRIARGSERVLIAVNKDGVDNGVLEFLEGIASSIKERYKLHYKYLDGDKIRAVVRNYLKHINSIELRGGVYFTPSSRLDELGRLRELIERVGNGCVMQDFPLVDLPRERANIVEAFQRDASAKLNQIVVDIAELQDTRKTITPAAYGKLKDQYDLVMAQATEYVETLEISQDVTGAAAELALKALTNLQVKMMESTD